MTIMITKIITHNGQFHADEVFACALLQNVFGDIPIERTRDISIDDIHNPDVWILDVNGAFDESLHLFDHHQDVNLESSNMLVLNYLRDEKIINEDLYYKLIGDFKSISHIDCSGFESFNGFQVNTLIKSFNSIENGFEAALKTAENYIMTKVIDCMLIEKSRQLFDDGEAISFMVKICEDYPIFWKSYNECEFLIAPDSNGRWCVHAKDSKQLPIIPNGTEEFIHANRFIAVYNSREEAIISGQNQFGLTKSR